MGLRLRVRGLIVRLVVKVSPPPITSRKTIADVNGWIVYIPAGDYGMATWVTLTGGTAVSIRLDGIIYRTG
jgi:rhamnogalacturonan hydrolase